MNPKAARLLRACRNVPRNGLVVEVGMCRRRDEVASDGWSTVYLAAAAAKHGFRLVSIDISEEPVDITRQLLDERGLTAKLILGDGATVLARIRGPIDLLYLDGAADPAEARAQYLAARLRRRATVVVDDAQPIDHDEHGKATQLLPLLRTDGWHVDVFPTEPEGGYLMAVATR